MKRKFIKKTKNVCSFKEYVANAKGFYMQAACEDRVLSQNFHIRKNKNNWY